MSRPSLNELKTKGLEKRGVKAEYDRLAPAYELRRRLIEIRLSAGLTQEQMAQALNTSKGNISRLENVNSSISPTIRTIARYAEAAGYILDIRFLPSGHG